MMSALAYVTISKKYLINCHILLKYFELVFFSVTTGKHFM